MLPANSQLNSFLLAKLFEQQHSLDVFKVSTFDCIIVNSRDKRISTESNGILSCTMISVY